MQKIMNDVTPESICAAWAISNEVEPDLHEVVAPLLYPPIQTIIDEFSFETNFSWVPNDYSDVRNYLLVQALKTYLNMIKQHEAMTAIKNHLGDLIM